MAVRSLRIAVKLISSSSKSKTKFYLSQIKELHKCKATAKIVFKLRSKMTKLLSELLHTLLNTNNNKDINHRSILKNEQSLLKMCKLHYLVLLYF